MLKCYHCTTLWNGSDPYKPDCDDSALLPNFLRPCTEWHLPGEGIPILWFLKMWVIVPQLWIIAFAGRLLSSDKATGVRGHSSSGNLSILADELEMVCVKVTGFLGETMHVLRGCIPAFLKDMMNRCENVDYDYETKDGVRIRNLRMCFCNEEACNGASTLMSRYGIGIIIALILKHLI